MQNNKITLSKTEVDDLNVFFQFQLDEEANYLAAFTSKDPTDKVAYLEKYSRHLADPTINNQTIRCNDEIVGSIAKFIIENDAVHGTTLEVSGGIIGKGLAK